jgi:hypothetical protein
MTLRIGDQAYGVDTTSPEALAYFRRAYAACLEPSHDETTAVFALDRRGESWVARSGDCEIARGPLHETIWTLEWHMLHRAVKKDTACAAFHAAWVARGAHAVVLAGEGGSGKSHLSLDLLSRGFRCGAEDVTFLSGERLVPFPHAIQLRGDDPALGGVEAGRVFAGCDGRICVELSTDEGALAMPTAALTIVVLDPAAGPLQPLGALEGLQRLLALCHRLDRVTQPVFDVFVAAAAAGRLMTGTADAGAISDLVGDA